jgi:hypothetical protein
VAKIVEDGRDKPIGGYIKTTKFREREQVAE